MLGKLPVQERPTIWITVGQGPTALAVGAGGGCLDIFTLIYPFSPLSPSLWETARYRLKYCLKGPLNPKQPTNYCKNSEYWDRWVGVYLLNIGMDEWMDEMRFYNFFSHIRFQSYQGRWKIDNQRLCAVEPRLRLRRFCLEQGSNLVCSISRPSLNPLSYRGSLIETDWQEPEQTVQTQIRLLLQEQSDQGLHCLPFHLHLLDA